MAAVPAFRGAAADRDAHATVFLPIGCIGVHWPLVMTVAIGCGIVRVMKGPAYVADPDPPHGRDSSV